MKKYVLLTIFSILFLFKVIAQSNPIMGYDIVTWGSSIQQVRNAYNIGNEIVTASFENDPNIIQITQKNVSESIKARHFMFIENKLFRVKVEYINANDDATQNLFNILESSFGNRTRYNTQTTLGMADRTEWKTETSTFGQYLPELVIELIHRVFYSKNVRNTNDLAKINSLYIQYTWQSFYLNYEASKFGL